jgi:hypothetical protein
LSQRHPRCVCVNAVDKGVSERFGVKAVDKGLMELGDCGNRFSGGEKEGLDGDTVQQSLVLSMAAFVAAFRSPWRPSFADKIRHGVRGGNWSEGRLRCS